MKKQTLKSINRSYHKHMKSLTSKGREQEILAALRDGKNTYVRMDRLESSSFDSSWIEVIENVIYDLGQIISNPRQVTKQEGNIVPIELARKTGAESVQHLASHTQYIKEIDEYGNVIPSKILAMYNEDDIKTYENRFIATFVRRLVLFVGKRYEYVSKFAELHDEQVLMFKNKSIVEGAEVEIETKIRINHKSDDDMSIKNNEYIERIKQMRQYILYFYNSQFMRTLKTEKDVHNPILQTNIIRKNPMYHHCYEVYRFIEKYEHLGVKYKVDEQFSVFNDTELAEINNTLFANYITLKGKDRSNVTKGTNKVYKPKILTSLDDEMFVYGPRLAGPIEFVRTDEGYQRYLDSKIRKDLPLHPTKREKEYYADEYAAKAENKEDLKQKEALLKRINKEVNAFNKQAAKIDQEREEARLKLLEEEKRLIKQEEDDLLSAARAEIIAGSLEDQENEKVFKEEKQKEAEIKVVEMSHPHQDPVTYEEATLEIWPALANAPTQRVPSEEEQAQPVEEPVSEPVVEEEPIEEAPAANEEPQEVLEEVEVEEAPIEEEQVVEEPQEQEEQAQPVPPSVAPYTHPHQEPVTYEEAAQEIWPNLKKAPVLRVAPKQEEPEAPVKEPEPIQEEQPKVEENKPEPVKKQRPKIPGSFVVKTNDGYYVENGKYASYKEGAKVFDDYNLAVDVKKVVGGKVIKISDALPEPVVENKPEPKVEQKPEPVKEKPQKEKKAPVKKAEPKPAPVKKPVVENKPKPAPVKKAEPKKEEKKPEPVVQPIVRPREKIPGRFIVKTNEGYYISEGKYSNSKEDAKVFDDFNLAKDIKKEKGGKVVKL